MSIPDFEMLMDEFVQGIRTGSIEIYNEFSLQHELGLHLRENLADSYKVQFERPSTHFGLVGRLEKKEIDISVISHDHREKFAFELKFPRKGQFPEQMFQACRDICFLEQLCRGGFTRGYLMMVADQQPFYMGNNRSGIYAYFRGREQITGVIRKPTGNKDHQVELSGRYVIRWRDVKPPMRYTVVGVMLT